MIYRNSVYRRADYKWKASFEFVSEASNLKDLRRIIKVVVKGEMEKRDMQAILIISRSVNTFAAE